MKGKKNKNLVFIMANQFSLEVITCRELKIRGGGRHLILSFLAFPLKIDSAENFSVLFLPQKLVRLFPSREVKASLDR